VEVLFAEVASVLALWAKQNAGNQLLAFEFHIGALMDMKLNHHLPKTALWKFQLNGIAQDVVFRQDKIKINHQCQ
jgi:hypothetical protein